MVPMTFVSFAYAIRQPWTPSFELQRVGLCWGVRRGHTSDCERLFDPGEEQLDRTQCFRDLESRDCMEHGFYY